MKKSKTVVAVEGGFVTRDAISGRFLEVDTAKGKTKANPRTQSVLKDAATKRHAALKRLADR